MQGTLEAVHAQLLYRIRMTGQSLSARDISEIFGNLWMKIESTFIDIDEDVLEEGWTFAVERVYEAAQNNPGSLVRSLLRERVASPEEVIPEEDHDKDLSDAQRGGCQALRTDKSTPAPKHEIEVDSTLDVARQRKGLSESAHGRTLSLW